MDQSADLHARQALGHVLARLRNAAGCTQEAFSSLTGYSRSTLANVETGRQRAPRGFWIRCDSLLTTAGRLTAEYDRIESARSQSHRWDAVHSLDSHDVAEESGPRDPHNATHTLPQQAERARLMNQAAHDGMAQAVHASAGLDGQSLADLFEHVGDIARRYTDRSRWETFVLASRSRDLIQEMAGRTRRPTELTDAYLLAGLANGLMASAAFDMAQRSAATSLARTSRTFAQLSGHASAIAWAHGLLATLMNWSDRPDSALRELDVVFNAQPGKAGRYRLHCIAARAHALRGDKTAARDSLEQAARHRPDDGYGTDLLHDEIGGEFRFDSARASACAGAVWLHLCDGPAAERSLRSALAAYTAMPSRERPIAPMQGTRVDLAASMLLRADLDAAAEILTPLFDLPPEQRISVITARLHTVRTMLAQPRWDAVSTAQKLGERIDDWMGTATTLPSSALS